NNGKTTPVPASTDPLISFGPNYSFLTRLACENATPRFGIGYWNAADCDFEVVFYFVFDFARAVPMRQGKATVNFRLRRILWREEIVKFFFIVDGAGVGIAKFQRPLVKILLDRSENFRRAGNEFPRYRGLFPFHWLITSAQLYRIFSRSRGPSSTRIGTPFLIHSQFLTPPPNWRRSISTSSGRLAYLFARSCAASLSQASNTWPRVSSFGVIGKITIWVGAIRGGKTTPSSSACAITMVPTMRVVIPQLVVQPNSCLPSRF